MCIVSVTTVKELTTTSSYAEWSLQQPSYNTTVNSTSQKNAEFSVIFRTRQTGGILFFASSFSKLEHAILEVICLNKNLPLRLNNQKTLFPLHATVIERHINSE
jgi:hypothetical protein